MLGVTVQAACSAMHVLHSFRMLLAGLALGAVAEASARVQVDARPAIGAPVERPGGPGWSRAALRGESLAAVRALFQRVDADGDGRLDVRESDHGGVDWTRFAAGDVDRDGGLDQEEFTVARQRELARRGQPAAPNLIAESTRIQALWRARAAQVERQRRPVPPADDTAARLARLLGPAPTEAPPPGARAPEIGVGPAQSRLSEALETSAAQTAERARRALLLLELRRKQRDQEP